MSDGGLFPRWRARRLLKSVRKGGGSEFKWKDWLVPGGIVAVALACVVLVYAFYPGRSGPAFYPGRSGPAMVRSPPHSPVARVPPDLSSLTERSQAGPREVSNRHLILVPLVTGDGITETSAGRGLGNMLATLRSSGSVAEVVILSDGPVPGSLSKTAAKFCARVVDTLDAYGQLYNNVAMEGEPLGLLWAFRYLRGLPGEGAAYGAVMIAAPEAVVFQADPFEHMHSKARLIFLASGSEPFVKEEVFLDSMQACFSPEDIDSMAEYPPVSSAALVGHPQQIVGLLGGLLRRAHKQYGLFPTSCDRHTAAQHLTAIAYSGELEATLQLNDGSENFAADLKGWPLSYVEDAPGGKGARDSSGAPVSVVLNWKASAPAARAADAVREAAGPSAACPGLAAEEAPAAGPAAARPGPRPGVALAPGFQAPVKIYVYEFSKLNEMVARNNSWWVNSDTTIAQQYTAEYVIHQSILRSPAFTPDPEAADFFFVPFYFSLFWGPTHLQQPLVDMRREIVEGLKKSPWFLRNLGKDHVFVYGSTRNMQQSFGGALWKLINQCTFLSIESNDARPGAFPFHRRRDLTVPYYVPVSKEDDDVDLASKTTRVFFRASRNHRAGLLRDLAVRVFSAHCAPEDCDLMLVDGVKSSRDAVEELDGSTALPPALAERMEVLAQKEREAVLETRERMRKSVFCLVPAGRTPSQRRFFEALAAKCIPVVISDKWLVPWSQHDPGLAEAALWIKEGQIARLPYILKDMAPEDVLRRQRVMLESRERFLYRMPRPQHGDALYALLDALAFRKNTAGTPGGMVPVRASKLKPRPLHELLPEGMDPLHPEAAEKIVEAQGRSHSWPWVPSEKSERRRVDDMRNRLKRSYGPGGGLAHLRGGGVGGGGGIEVAGGEGGPV